ncbi:MAG TPA: SHOCT domain-containing protein [Allosphingosinicella sp.]|jgi:hypothetical protein
MSSRYDELDRLQRLRESGVLTDEEFQVEKRRLLGHQSLPPAGEGVEAEARPASRRRIWILLGTAALVVAAAVGLILGRTSGGEDGIIDLPMPAGNESAGSNLVETKALPDIRTLAADEQLARAFEAAFGSRGEAVVSVPGDGSDEDVRFAPGRLIWPAFGPVLISEGKVQDPSHASAGRIAVHYLRPAADRFEVARAFPSAVVTGSSGQVARWTLSPQFSSWPVVVAEGGGTAQGYTCSWLTLTELRPAGPVKLAQVPLVYDDTGAREDGTARSIEGKILNVVRNQSFDVVYSGSRAFSEHYVRSGDRYAVAGGGKPIMETC